MRPLRRALPCRFQANVCCQTRSGIVACPHRTEPGSAHTGSGLAHFVYRDPSPQGPHHHKKAFGAACRAPTGVSFRDGPLAGGTTGRPPATATISRSGGPWVPPSTGDMYGGTRDAQARVDLKHLNNEPTSSQALLSGQTTLRRHPVGLPEGRLDAPERHSDPSFGRPGKPARHRLSGRDRRPRPVPPQAGPGPPAGACQKRSRKNTSPGAGLRRGSSRIRKNGAKRPPGRPRPAGRSPASPAPPSRRPRSIRNGRWPGRSCAPAAAAWPGSRPAIRPGRSPSAGSTCGQARERPCRPGRTCRS